MGRIKSIDVFRLLAITFVIAIHTTPFVIRDGDNNQLYNFLSVFINQLARFAVPFFFIISGYFWAIKIKKKQSVLRPSFIMAKKIGIIFLFWSVIYLLPLNFSAFFEYGLLGPVKVAYWHIQDLLKNPILLIFEGTRVHLWFLMSLIYALFINALFIHFGRVKELILFSVVLYLFGLLAKAYAGTPIGILIDFNTRNGPFFSTIFFTTGYVLSAFEAKAKWLWLGLAIFILGCLSHFMEIIILWKFFNTAVSQDYVFGTYFMGLGIAMLALSDHPIFSANRLAVLGRYTLGIYAIHMIYVINFAKIDRVYSSVVWEIGLIFMVLFLSIFTVILLARMSFMRKFLE